LRQPSHEASLHVASKPKKKIAAGFLGSLRLFRLPRIQSLRALRFILGKQDESTDQKLDM
jgi:hypothetical protein